MIRNRSALLLALPLLAALAGCGVGTPTPDAGSPDETASPAPTPTPTPTSTPTPAPTATVTPTPTPDEEPAPVVLATAVVVTSELVAAYAADGTQLAAVAYDESDHEDAAARLAVALGLEPVVGTTGAIGTGCDADQTVYDFGGFLLRSPGYVGSIGPIEVEVDGATTTNGVPVVSRGGSRIGMTRVDFDAAVGVVTDLGAYDGRNWVGFDRRNPDAEGHDAIGSLARFDDGVLAQWNGPVYFYGDC